MKKKICCLLVFFISIIGISQSIKIGGWNIHANYSEINVMTAVNNKVYVGTKSGLFIYSQNDNSLTVFSKIDGLNSLNISALTHDASTNSLIIGYADGNIDIMKDGLIRNVPDIYLANILGSKKINNIFVENNLAYFSCPFGLVVYNLNKMEVKETYYFYDDLNVAAEVYQVYVFDGEFGDAGYNFLANKIFVGTQAGLFYANKNSNLLDYSSWSNEAFSVLPKFGNMNLFGVPVTHVIGVDLQNSGGKRLMIATNTQNEHNLFELGSEANSTQLTFNPKQDIIGNVININYNSTCKKFAVIINEDNIVLMNQFFETVNYLSVEDINNPFDSPSYTDVVPLDNYNSSRRMLLGHSNVGAVLVEIENNVDFISPVRPNGPFSQNIGALSSYGSNLVFAHGGQTTSWNNAYNNEEVSFFNGQLWYQSDTLQKLNIYDVVSGIALHDRFFLGTWNNGILEFSNNQLVGHYNSENKPQIESINGTNDWSRIGGMDIDSNNDIWFTNSETNKPLIKLSLNPRNWTSFNVPGLTTSRACREILCANNNYKWVRFREGTSGKKGIVVLNEDLSDYKELNSTNGIYGEASCFDEDDSGAMWIGGSQGLSVVYFPEELFNDPSYLPEPILIETDDGNIERLFDNVEILDIKIDGGNRKWIATKNSGVFLVSEDGAEQIHNFTKENSPLLDNLVYKINIMEESGEVFFATSKGLCSYRSDASQSKENFDNAIVFPNPVKKDYSGHIAVSGLSNNTSVKITDISGNLVFETYSIGGTATWSGNRFDGERVKTGVYLFLCTSEDFEKSVVKKVLIY